VIVADRIEQAIKAREKKGTAMHSKVIVTPGHRGNF
jgi:hypothetical protein